MFNMFKKKDKGFVTLVVPAEHVLEVIRLWDTLANITTNGFHMAKYQLWLKIETIFPEVADIERNWQIVQYHSTEIHIKEMAL